MRLEKSAREKNLAASGLSNSGFEFGSGADDYRSAMRQSEDVYANIAVQQRGCSGAVAHSVVTV